MKQGIIRYTWAFGGLLEFVISNRTNTGGVRRIFQLQGDCQDMTIELNQQEYRDMIEDGKGVLVRWYDNSVYNMETIESIIARIVKNERDKYSKGEVVGETPIVENPTVGFFTRHKRKFGIGGLFVLSFVVGFVGYKVYENYTNSVDLDIVDEDLLNIDEV